MSDISKRLITVYNTELLSLYKLFCDIHARSRQQPTGPELQESLAELVNLTPDFINLIGNVLRVLHEAEPSTAGDDPRPRGPDAPRLSEQEVDDLLRGIVGLPKEEQVDVVKPSAPASQEPAQPNAPESDRNITGER